ncbi:putative YkwD family protein [Scopulibacillus darangshiensis]|uniref:Putative YkwD family protein n=1 Tax=Scopulibacillus darangshiensis TaxID=442528 RepID=A0A4R2NNX1_9BACL|nr:CAP domain-containing protein [Scopulibacillus darangshiensis]TCP23489.1 putative YkwD family protein [Scopulibacillus darangshiensis]
MKKFLAIALTGFLAVPAFASTEAHAQTSKQPCNSDAKQQVNVDQSHGIKELSERYNIDINSLIKKYKENGSKIYIKYNSNKGDQGNDSSKAEQPKKDSAKKQDSADKQAQNNDSQKSEQAAPAPQKQDNSANQASQNNAKQPSQDQAKQSNSQLNAYEQKVVELTNKERTNRGLQPLKVDNELAKMARDKSADMRDKGYFDHQSPTYGSPFDMMKSYGIDYTAAGENIAAGQKTPQDVVDAWMKSPGHRANILNKDYTYIGVGYVKGGSYGSYWTQEFIKK